MKTKKRMVVSVLSVVLLMGAKSAQCQWTVENLTRPGGTICGFRSADAQDEAHWRQFDALWQERKTRDVTPDIIPFLSDKYPPLRSRAVQALGQLEAPESVEPLQARKRIESYDAGASRFSPLTFDLALGRIASRGLKGQDKVAAMMKQIGLSWPDLVQLSQKINGDTDRYRMQSAPGEKVMEEVVDLIYTMGKRGENVEAIAQQLTLLPAQQAQIKASSLDDAKESEALVDYLSNLYGARWEDIRLSNHLVNLGDVATTSILARLQEMKQNPNQGQGLEPYPGHPGAFRQRMGCEMVLRAASQTNDPRMIPLFQHFAKSPHEWVRRDAEMAIEHAKLRVRLKELKKS